MTPIDLRSDTVTRPDRAMRDAIARAEVGDDVLGDDPTVLALQERVARELGKEAALYVPSGTMGNQLALASQTAPGDQVIVEAQAHIWRYEAGAPAALSGLQLTPVPADRGVLTWPAVEAALFPQDIHCARPAMVCVENTHNRAGGTIVPLEALEHLASAVHGRGLKVHLDGARLWNAAVATGIAPARWAASVDSLSVCFSKGLGAPVGSVLVASTEVVERARRLRKRWGGGMRQVGLLAAACLYALDANVERLAEDHANARALAERFRHPALQCVATPQTNIVFFDVDPVVGAQRVVEALRATGVLVAAMDPTRLRLVTHKDVSAADCELAIRAAASLRL